MVEPTDGRLMHPAPIDWGRGQLSSATGECHAAGRGEEKSRME